MARSNDTFKSWISYGFERMTKSALSSDRLAASG